MINTKYFQYKNNRLNLKTKKRQLIQVHLCHVLSKNSEWPSARQYRIHKWDPIDLPSFSAPEAGSL